MKRHLLLQGDIAVGKSTLLRKTLLPHLENVGGFYVQRVFRGKEYAAFQLQPLGNTEDYQLNKYVERLPEKDNFFLYCDENNQWYTQLDVLEQKGVMYLQRSREENKKLILMDEIGGVDLHCPLFMQTVLQILDGSQPVLGVLKAPRNIKKLNSRLAEPENKVKNMGKTLAVIKKHPLVELLEISRENYAEIKLSVQAFVKNALLPGK